jgi:hypothetical protein
MFELLKHPHCRDIDWYRSLFSVGFLYPPFFYFASAVMKFLFGAQCESERIANLLFVGVTFFSVYYAAKETYKSNLTAGIAAILVFLYPAVFWATHCVLLDCAVNAMVALGLCSFIWWGKEPCLRRSIALGFVLGLVILTKNYTAAFLVGPALVDIAIALKTQNTARVWQWCTAALVCAVIVLPWASLAGPTVRNVILSVQAETLSTHDTLNPILAFFQNFSSFAGLDLINGLSPLLWSCFLVALIAGRTWNRNKFYLLASVLAGILIASSFRWLHQDRYIFPACIPISILTAEMFGRAWFSGRASLRSLVLIAAACAFLQFLYVGFMPYPIRSPLWFSKCMSAMGASRRANSQGISSHPLPQEDWGALWALAIIERARSDHQILMMVMPDRDVITSSTYNYLVHTREDNIRVVEGRANAALGDRVTFNPELAGAIDWYILCIGDQGRNLIDSASVDAYDRWCEFVRSSKYFKLKGTKKLPDGTVLLVYGRTF